METNLKDNMLVPLSLESFNTRVNANLSTVEENLNILFNCVTVIKDFSLFKPKEDLTLRVKNKCPTENGFPLIKRMKLDASSYSVVTVFN